jgi:hypothetical protein
MEKKCNGDCLKCSMAQQIYCAAQTSNIAMRLVEKLSEEVKSLRESITSKAVFNPLADNDEQEAQ